MTKYLHIIRHAKSDWSNECADYDRGLNARGFEDAKLIGEYLLESHYQYEQVFCSSAVRAKTTFNELNHYLKIEDANIQLIDDLYLASCPTLFAFIQHIDNHYNEVAILGHNPGLTELCYFLTGDYLQNLPTCAVYSVEFELDDWRAVGCESGRTTKFITPRQLKDH